jgi:hypothetical protein
MNKIKIGGVHLTLAEIDKVFQVARFFNWTKLKGNSFDLTKILRFFPDLFHFAICVLTLCFYLFMVTVCLVQKVVFFQEMTRELELCLDHTLKELQRTNDQLKITVKKQVHLLRCIAALKGASNRKISQWEDLSTSGKKARQRRAKRLVTNAKRLVGGISKEFVKCFDVKALLKLIEASYGEETNSKVREIVFDEIRKSIPLDTVVQLKEVGGISDTTYGMLERNRTDLQDY